MFDDTVTDVNIYGRDLAPIPSSGFMPYPLHLARSLHSHSRLAGYIFGGLTDAWGCVFAAFLRTVLFQNSVWAVNSFGHTFGYENFNMNNNSKNNSVLAALTFGDGYHNNHHRFPRSAFHGMRKGELDLNGLIIVASAKSASPATSSSPTATSAKSARPFPCAIAELASDD